MNDSSPDQPLFYDADGIRVTSQAITAPGFTYLIRDVRAARLQLVEFSGWRVHIKIAGFLVLGFAVALVIPQVGWVAIFGALLAEMFTGAALSLRVVINTSAGDAIVAEYSIWPFRPRAERKHEEAAQKSERLLDAITQALIHESQPKVA